MSSYQHLIKERKEEKRNSWADLRVSLGDAYADYLLASVAKHYPSELRCRFDREASGLIIKPGLKDVAIPAEYGGGSIRFVINPHLKKVDAISLAADDRRDDWRYGHSSVYYVFTGPTGEIRAVSAPEGHLPSKLELSDGALDLLDKYEEDSLPVPQVTKEQLAFIQ